MVSESGAEHLTDSIKPDVQMSTACLMRWTFSRAPFEDVMCLFCLAVLAGRMIVKGCGMREVGLAVHEEHSLPKASSQAEESHYFLWPLFLERGQ